MMNEGVSPAAIVSFGSPPVGNDAFCDWFNAMVPTSWRFVCGDEFAPMAPPLPFTSQERFKNQPQVLTHVKGLVKIEDGQILRTTGSADEDEMEARMDELAGQLFLSKIVSDHNLALTLRAIQ